MMKKNGIQLSIVDLTDAGEAVYRDLHEFMLIMQAERSPNDPPQPLAERIASWQNMPPIMRLTWWVARAGESGPVVGHAYVSDADMPENRQAAEASVAVHPAYRRRGIGSLLARLVAETAERADRRLLIAQTTESVPAGERFVAGFGGRRGMETHVNQLDLHGVDGNLLAEWVAAGPTAFEIGLWDGPYPEEDMAGIVTLMEVMNQAPRDDLEVNDVQWTPELVRQVEAYQLGGGKRRWVIYARELGSGNFAGFSEVVLRPSVPEIVEQGNTGVLPAYRGQGLGKALKAMMLQKLLAEWPEGRYVRTGNADSNAPMLRINDALGFRPDLAYTVWQVETKGVLEKAGEERRGASGQPRS